MAKSELSFEAAMKELEILAEKMESPDCTLAKSIDYFEKSVALMKTCDSHLKNAEGRLSELMKSENGEFVRTVLGESAQTDNGESFDED